MPIESRLLFFSNLGFFFSMQVRGIYAFGSTHSDSTLRAINEATHRLFQCLKGLAKGGSNRMPEETVLRMLQDIVIEGGLEEEFLWAVSEAEKTLVS
ncbi:hypothetical protein ACQZ32_02805 [Ralstonia pseudosolanacearum]|uniref:hypothetical protein n=1 Tax=Ralstonia pseudosolanacearum TaxID=1310165 RepID=UPI0012DA3881|nr:hypothetical protein [Ralstonia pseudosolanacearum]MDC6286717.1 hypothetical protein [Ralstonia pseudosolanacearum]MDC6294303.1 hypothetical protein [Ralstonia pseudosolanacearum]MDD7789197.1 hypothetical protein [Ralstonia pseudosolanacearum]MDN3370402.1 hypothetical protein [Ralstonia pseudosolanacearum]QOK89193.1 hypothetical protein HF907_21510 [Ralstonia pseudosolanacearum]